MLNRRELLKLSGVATVAFLTGINIAENTRPQGPFRFCFNTSTIRGQNPALPAAMEIAAKAGYDGMETCRQWEAQSTFTGTL